ncbi:type II toxin-antitoxin system VapC family toxin [Serratia sp. Lou2A]|jgi:tRNA(fMet)-specific endonuclease VapC|uniref:Ribonuclease VapC n=1 Tax=Serratia montpellierensis TaxID=2598730 RepID=A0ABS8J8U5_9GAMM|nr:MULTISPECIES: type II toxin-antitoxin system VapC family toxin [Serratia]MBH2580578.1 type II toxin-antitoxin system VapC family toxin [Serratia marcescens]MBH2868255.1 type II toxin-antitoxin system VapC family toxin [Serratia marcescens]MBH3201488.1 type II toxin-antitoxin system VapC family toxin [Serratia marcescens]MBI6125880.1 type II toxin-antitoxin system VapC family toxin [Serratia marcescens]MBL5823903.1 type II toxin-antitoxin system VapC family toxin [Serratia marcescens]
MYMFDTNTVSHLFRQHPQVLSIMEKLPPSAVCISSVTEAELLYGVAKRRNKALQSMVEAFLAAVTVYAWDSEAARCYGEMRANMERKGKIMGALDQLIAAHAQSRGATLVTNDRAFAMVPGLAVEDWTR